MLRLLECRDRRNFTLACVNALNARICFRAGLLVSAHGSARETSGLEA